VFPTRYKAKISKLMSYPVGAEALSTALADVPQSGSISICFGRSSYETNLRPGHASRYRVLSSVYSHRSPSQFSSAYMLTRGHYNPGWEIHVHEVPRVHRHVVRSLLLNEGLPRLADWFRRFSSLHGQEGSCSLAFTFDEAQQILEFEASKWMIPHVER
jgi:hypothetical protein